MKPPPQSRRGRPAKPALSRSAIVGVAIGILMRDGLGKVTMRSVATALDTGAASLYVYVRDTEDLHAQILDALLAGIIEDATGGDWRARLKALLLRYTELLFGLPDMARMAMSTLPSGANYLTLVDAILGLLHEGCVGDAEAAWAVDQLLLHATAHAAEHGGWIEEGGRAAEFSTLGAAIEGADPAVYPQIARLGADLLSGGPARLLWGLDVLINGALSTPRPG